jgi:heme-degrading monooxygenase HmoA
MQHVEGVGWRKLLRDTEDPTRFFKLGAWESLAAIESWRALDGWHERVVRMQELLESFEASTLEIVVERG